MSLKAGARVKSATSACEVMIIRPATTSEVLSCAGAEMQARTEPAGLVVVTPPVLIGKRYADEVSGIEVLCVHPGGGPLRIGDRELVERAAKQLPASD